MIGVRFKIAAFLFTLFMGSLLCLHKGKGLDSKISANLVQNTLSHTLEKEMAKMSTSYFSKKRYSRLKKIIAKIDTKDLQKDYRKILRSYKAQNSYLLRRNLANIRKQKIHRREVNLFEINTWKNQQHQYFVTLFFLSVLGFLFISFYLYRSTFKPLHLLYYRMVSFLNNKHTYEFVLPKPSEVGNLHIAFNSLAQQVRRNLDEFESLDKAKSEFLSIASHELRTPLTSIKGSLSLLKNGIVGELPPEAMHLMNIAEKETDRLVRLINDLLDLTKIEAQKLPLKKEWCSLKKIITDTVQSLQGFSATAKVSIIVSDLPQAYIFGDKDRIQQVLTNLLSNAIKYSPSEKAVTINYFINPQNALEIQIADQGCGIPPDVQHYIFQKFSQATGSTNPLVKGTGLGLAIAKALVEEHEGTIGVHSSPKEGSTFYFSLPKWKYSLVDISDAPPVENESSPKETAA